jgi:hypothetical protein
LVGGSGDGEFIGVYANVNIFFVLGWAARKIFGVWELEERARELGCGGNHAGRLE